MPDMRVHSAVLAGVLCLVAAVASADITGLSPSSFTPSGEDFITIMGTNLTGTVSTVVVFDGVYEVEPSLASSTSLVVWVPGEVLVEGSHCVTVRSVDALAVRTHGPACFTVEAAGLPDDGPPLLALPEVIGEEATSPSGAVVNYEASAVDAGGSVTTICTPSSGSVFPLGTTTVQCSATNAFGTTAGSFVVVVSDDTRPVLTLPDDIFSDDPVVTFTVTAVDDIDGPVAASCSPPSGSTFIPGTTLVRCQAVDAHLNYAAGSFRVIVAGGAPVITVPDDLYEEATGPSGAVVTFTATADDSSPVTCNPASGSTFPLGTTLVTCTAGIGSATFNVTVVDTTAPVITAPALLTIEATSAAGAIVTYVATATDLVDGAVPVSCAPESGSLFPMGVTDVFCTAIDAHLNSDTLSFPVTVEDTTPPEVTSITATPGVLWPPNHQMVDVVVTVTLVDAVDPAPTVQIISVTSNQPINGTGDGDVAPDWEITGPLTLQLRAERAGSAERIYTITVQTQDANGNIGTETVEVRVSDSQRRAAARH